MAGGAGWGAAAQAAGSIGSQFISNAGNARRQKKDQRYNYLMWQEQNRYNHPSAQMSRLREAGLNPNLIYGDSVSGATGRADKIPETKAQPYKFENPFNNIGAYANLKSTEAQTNNLQAQNDVIRQDAILKGMQASNIGMKTATGSFELGLAKELRDNSLEASKLNVASMEQKIMGDELDNQFKSLTMKNRVKDILYRVKIAEETLTGTQLSNTLKALDIELQQIGIQKNDSFLWRWIGRKENRQKFSDWNDNQYIKAMEDIRNHKNRD